MKAELTGLIHLGWRFFWQNIPSMSRNIFLALIPFGLSIWLFRRDRPRSAYWWLGLLIFIAFLPNAPYVLTDIIHLIYQIQHRPSVWVITLILIPQYFVFCLLGLEAYVLSLMNLGFYLRRIGRSKWILWSELALHFLSAVGIYLGRFNRWNTWDLLTETDGVFNSVIDNLIGARPALVIFVTVIVIAGLYWLMKQLSLAIAIQHKLGKFYTEVSQI